MAKEPPSRTPEERKATALRMVRRLTAEHDEAREARDAAIRAAHEAGASLRELADASGVGHMTVKRIVDREE